ncbi:hypothetical protein ENBRE01_0711 [Enteropsectra breve]|nr:hypothetical protein ENBRE01_0711 [Enteropsectra breve]
MIGLISLVSILVSNISAGSEKKCIRKAPFNQYTANDKMMLMRIPDLNEKTKSFTKCHFCKSRIVKSEYVEDRTLVEEDDVNISFGNYSINYFHCPQCDSIGHINCLFDHSENSVYACANPRCKLVFKSNDLNRLFAQLFYVFVHRNQNFEVYQRFYNRYLKKETVYTQKILMNILIESKTLLDIDQPKLWLSLISYFNWNYINYSGKFKVYLKVLDEGHAESIKNFIAGHGVDKQGLFDEATVLYRINNMRKMFKEEMTSEKLLSFYNENIEKEASSRIKKTLAAHFIHSVMALHNPLLCLEEIYINKFKSNVLVIAGPLKDETLRSIIENPSNLISTTKNINENAQDFLFYLLIEFENNNMFRLVQMACTYCRLDNKDVFIPALMSFFTAKGRTDIVKKIIGIQLQKLSTSNRKYDISLEKASFAFGLFPPVGEKKSSQIIESQRQELSINNRDQDISLKNASYVLAEAERIRFPTTIEHIDEILNWMTVWQSKLASEDVACISSLLKAHMNAPENKESIIDIQKMFVRYYTPDLEQFYMECMPKAFYTDDALLEFKDMRSEHLKYRGIYDYDAAAKIEHINRLAIRKSNHGANKPKGITNQVKN